MMANRSQLPVVEKTQTAKSVGKFISVMAGDVKPI